MENNVRILNSSLKKKGEFFLFSFIHSLQGKYENHFRHNQKIL